MRIVAVVGNPRPASRTHGLARTLAVELAQVLPDAAFREVDLAALGPRVLDPSDTDASAAIEQVLDADLLIVASPTYKATYSGLLKAFLDRFATGSLAGKLPSRCCWVAHPTISSPLTCTLRRCCSSSARPSRCAACSSSSLR